MRARSVVGRRRFRIVSTRAATRLPLIQFLERRSRRQRLLGVSLLAVFVAWVALRAVARTLLDRWWLDSVTDAPIWTRRTAAQLELGFGAAFLVLLTIGSTVWIVLRVTDLTTDPPHRMWQRYRERIGPAHRWGLIALTLYLTWQIGRSAAGRWQTWLLFRHGKDLDVEVPRLGGDLGFYLFRLPFLAAVASFLLQILLVALGIAVLGHAASGALRWPRGEQRSAPAAVIHVSVLTATVMAVLAARHVVIGRATVATNRIGAFDGPGFTEIFITRPALVVAASSALALGVAAVQAGRTRRLRGLVVVAVIAGLVHLGGLVVAPRIAETYVVAPAEAERQLWSIDNNLRATRTAYGLDAIAMNARPLADGITGPGRVPVFGDARGIPLFNTSSLTTSLQVLAGTTGTRIRNVDIAEYELEGTRRPVYTATRPTSLVDLPERGWVQQHLVYTHGDGVVALAADVVDDDGRPDVTSAPELDDAAHSPLYYGEGLENWYAITGTRRTEAGGNSYAGSGVDLGSAIRRMTFALAVGETPPLFSSELTDESLLLYRRGIAERVTAVAPFLKLDRDPYVVLDGGRVTWVVDAYTTASTYPYAQFAPSDAPPAFIGANYVQASVVITIDALDGTMHLYRTDDRTSDPIIAAWADVFPSLFEPIDQLPQGVADHLRYPEDFFALQTTLLGRYHVTDAELLFSGTDRWTISPAAAVAVGGDSPGAAPPVDLFATGDQFQTVRTFGPGAAGNPAATRDELVAMAIADHSVDRAFEVVVPDGDRVVSPQVAQSAIDADPDLAQQITLLNANGSHVEFGPITPILIGDGIVWARPIVVIGTSAASAPRLYGVAVVSDGVVTIGATLGEALAAIR
jgi:uncharacterized membrane protein (UPF0182 family)